MLYVVVYPLAALGALLVALLLVGFLIGVHEGMRGRRGAGSFAQHVDEALDVFDDGEPLTDEQFNLRWQTIAPKWASDTEGGYR